MEAYKKAGNRKNEPPKHEMVHFAGLLSSKREFGDFRTVLHTGLYSQVVAMEIPVNGEIGDEVLLVSWLLHNRTVYMHTDNLFRFTRLIKSLCSHLVGVSRR